MGSVSAETIYEPGSVALRGGRRESRRDVKRRPETRAVVGEFDANAVQVGDGLDEREAQTVAFAGAGRVQPDEAAEHAVALRVRDPGTRVRYGTPEPKAVAAQRHGDAGSRPGVADRVLDQVRQHLGEEVAVAAHAEPRDDLDHHGLAGIFRHRPVGFGDGREHGRQVDVRETAAARSGFDLGDPEQRREDAQDSIHVAARGLDGGLVSLGGPRALPRRFEPLPQVVSGVRRSWAISFDTCRRPSMSSWMRSSISLVFDASLSNSSPVPRVGTRRPRSPSIMGRMMSFMASTRRSAPRLVTTPPRIASISVMAAATPKLWISCSSTSLTSRVSRPTISSSPVGSTCPSTSTR